MNQELLNLHADELKKISYGVLLSIAKGEEPLTYSFVSNEGEHQIEVNFSDFNENEMDMIISIDSSWKARIENQSLSQAIHITKS